MSLTKLDEKQSQNEEMKEYVLADCKDDGVTIAEVIEAGHETVIAEVKVLTDIDMDVQHELSPAFQEFLRSPTAKANIDVASLMRRLG